VSTKLLLPQDELAKKFYSLRLPGDVAALLDIEYKQLTYYLYFRKPAKQYEAFYIPKKSGGFRRINAPITPLKIIQKKLNQVLQSVYQPKAPVHSFLADRSIVTNASLHLKKKYVLNLDLENFFPSINFGRVRGLFLSTPYNLPAPVATILAQICSVENELPQGAPTSPIISNMICSKMDSKLRLLAQKYRCTYSRYADDITFSTTVPNFPVGIARYSSEHPNQIELGEELLQIIRDNGFEVNTQKTRLQTKYRKQEVTGLTVNEFPNVDRKYVSQIRAMLHAAQKYGIPDAEAEYHKRYLKKHRRPDREPPQFLKVVKGKIDFLGMVRGKENRIYQAFYQQLAELAPDQIKIPIKTKPSVSIVRPLIITEGKTDWQHLKSALKRLNELGYPNLPEIDLLEFGDDYPSGDAEILKYCERYAQTFQLRPHIFMFDRDNTNILPKVCSQGSSYKNWGNNVFSFAIPFPGHREEGSLISLEFFYKEADLQKCDPTGRRLFLSSEFNPRSGRHLSMDLNCTDKKYQVADKVAIVDDKVFDANHQNVALSKSNFAKYILNREGEFADADFSEFVKIFEVITEIIRNHYTLSLAAKNLP